MQRQLEHPFIHSLHDCWQTQRHLFISELSPNPNPQLQPYIEASLVEIGPALPEVIQKIAAAPGPPPSPPDRVIDVVPFLLLPELGVKYLRCVSFSLQCAATAATETCTPTGRWRASLRRRRFDSLQQSWAVLWVCAFNHQLRSVKGTFHKSIPVQSLLTFPCGSKALSVHFHWLGALSGDFKHWSFLFVIFLSYILTPHLLFVIPGFIHDLGIMHRDVKV